MSKPLSKSSEVRKVVGKRVKNIRLNPFSDGRKRTAYEPVIEFEDGTTMRFVVTETEVGEYGVCPIVDTTPS